MNQYCVTTDEDQTLVDSGGGVWQKQDDKNEIFGTKYENGGGVFSASHRDQREDEELSLRDSDMERTAWDVLIPPFDDQDVAALFFHGVRYVVHPVTQVFHIDLLAGRLRPMDANHQHVGTCRVASGETESQRWKYVHVFTSLSGF